MVDHVEQVRSRMAQVWPIVREHLRQAQQAQAWVYNRGAQLRIFRPGELVQVLIPTAECKFLAKWQGPYEVVDRVGEVNFRVRQPRERNLKQWRTSTSPPVRTPLVLAARRGIPEVPVGDDLSPTQKHDEVVLQHQDVFSEIPGRTTVSQHDIKRPPAS